MKTLNTTKTFAHSMNIPTKKKYQDSKMNLKNFTVFSVLGFVLIGLYNSVVINSASNINYSPDLYVKRLDEMNGVFIPARKIAGFLPRKKIVKSIVKKSTAAKKINTFKPTESYKNVETPSIIDGEINLQLTEVINQKLWKNGLNASRFSGSLSAREGVIDSLDIQISEKDSISVSYGQLTGNVFDYEVAGETYSGLLYQVDQNAYMVNLTSGPLEGTRLRFTNGDSSVARNEDQEYLAENNIKPGEFGSTQPEENSYYAQDSYRQEETAMMDKEMQNESLEMEQYHHENDMNNTDHQVNG